MMRASHRNVLLLALVTTAGALPGRALAQQVHQAPQSPKAVESPQSPQSQSATTAPLSAYGTCARQPTQADTDAAHGAYMAGKGSFDEADYTTALNYFKDAYRRDCTKHELLVIIARAYELKGDKREAVHALEAYLERMPNASDAEVQKRRIANLKREVVDAPPPVAPSVSPPVSVTVATTPPASAESASSSTPAAHHSIAPWIVVGVGGAVLITGAILLPVGAGKVSDAEKACPNHVCPSGDTTSIDSGNSGRTTETLGAILLPVGAAAIAGGLIWHFMEPKAKTAAAPRITPQMGPGYAGVTVGGAF
jgi:hypothetical protein